MTPQEAYNKARNEGPSTITRDIACKDSLWAYLYAADVDKSPRNDTRTAACLHSCWAFSYAEKVDKKVLPETRISVSKSKNWSFWFAVELEEWLHEALIKELDVIRYSILEQMLEFN